MAKKKKQQDSLFTVQHDVRDLQGYKPEQPSVYQLEQIPDDEYLNRNSQDAAAQQWWQETLGKKKADDASGMDILSPSETTQPQKSVASPQSQAEPDSVIDESYYNSNPLVPPDLGQSELVLRNSLRQGAPEVKKPLGEVQIRPRYKQEMTLEQARYAIGQGNAVVKNGYVYPVEGGKVYEYPTHRVVDGDLKMLDYSGLLPSENISAQQYEQSRFDRPTENPVWGAITGAFQGMGGDALTGIRNVFAPNGTEYARPYQAAYSRSPTAETIGRIGGNMLLGMGTGGTASAFGASPYLAGALGAAMPTAVENVNPVLRGEQNPYAALGQVGLAGLGGGLVSRMEAPLYQALGKGDIGMGKFLGKTVRDNTAVALGQELGNIGIDAAQGKQTSLNDNLKRLTASGLINAATSLGANFLGGAKVVRSKAQEDPSLRQNLTESFTNEQMSPPPQQGEITIPPPDVPLDEVAMHQATSSASNIFASEGRMDALTQAEKRLPKQSGAAPTILKMLFRNPGVLSGSAKAVGSNLSTYRIDPGIDIAAARNLYKGMTGQDATGVPVNHLYQTIYDVATGAKPMPVVEQNYITATDSRAPFHDNVMTGNAANDPIITTLASIEERDLFNQAFSTLKDMQEAVAGFDKYNVSIGKNPDKFDRASPVEIRKYLKKQYDKYLSNQFFDIADGSYKNTVDEHKAAGGETQTLSEQALPEAPPSQEASPGE